MRNTLNRKYLMQAIDGSLERLGLDFVDLVYCHRPDPETPVEETVWAMSDMISAGKALYWGTSEWSAEAAPRGVGHRRPPPPAQAGRRAAPVQPVLAGPGRAGVRPPLRRHRPRADHLEPAGLGPADRQVPRRGARGLAGHPARLRVAGATCSPTRTATRRCRSSRRSPRSSTARWPSCPSPGARRTRTCRPVITGASRVEQVHENLAALDVMPKLTDDVMARIAAVVA